MDWEELTLFIYITARMSGFVMFNPILGRRGLPAMFRAGFVLILSFCVMPLYSGAVIVPNTLIEMALRIVLEIALGYLVGLIMDLFFYIPILAGEVVDMQMGMSMAKIYDAGLQSSLSLSATLINILMMLLFFAANGHNTLMRILMTSGDILPYGKAALSGDAQQLILELFVECTLLALKACLPILAAELMGQVGMGVLMKVIPQINIFAINIELKVILGMVMLLMLLSPLSEFLLDAENTMLAELRHALMLAQ